MILVRPSSRAHAARAPAQVAALALVLAAGGCRKEQEAPVPPPGMVDGLGRPRAPTPPQPSAPPPNPPAEPTVYDFENPGRMDPGALSAPQAGESAKPTPAPVPSGAQEAKRDLGAELGGKLADVSSCVDVALAAAQPGGRLTISVTAYVQGSGRVSRATVTAPGQPTSAVSCIQKQVLALSLPGPIPDAPTEVRGSTDLQFKLVGGAASDTPTTGGAATAPPPQPLNPNIARPAENTELAKPDPGDLAGPP